jgi:hypothetical protein
MLVDHPSDHHLSDATARNPEICNDSARKRFANPTDLITPVRVTFDLRNALSYVLLRRADAYAVLRECAPPGRAHRDHRTEDVDHEPVAVIVDRHFSPIG